MNTKTARAALFWIMALSTAWEWIITVSLFTNPEIEAAQFNGPVNEQTIFFSHILGGFMILFSTLCGLCAYQVRARDPHGRTLALLIGVFWIYIGIGLYLHPGAPAYVLGDTLRGLVIAALAWKLEKTPQKPAAP